MKKRFLCLALVFAMAATQAVPVAAASRKQTVEAEKSETQSKLSQAEDKVNDLESEKNSLMGQINSTQQELVSIMAQINMLKDEITDKEADIKETQEDLKEAEADRDEQYEQAMAASMIEQRYQKENEWLDAMLTGNMDKISAAMRELARFQLPGRFQSLRGAQNIAIILNTLCRKNIERAGVHPAFIDQIARQFTGRIDSCNE